MRTSFVAAAGLAFSAFALVVGACSDASRPPAGGGGGEFTSASSGGSSSGDGGGSSSGDGAASDGSSNGTIPSPERLCDPLPQRGSEVAELAQPYNTPPGNGGPITAGTYVLRALDVYVGPKPPPDGGEAPVPVPTGKAGRGTVYVTSNAMRFNEARGNTGGLGADTRRGFSYSANAGKLELTSQCPQLGTKTSISYSATSSLLTLVLDATHVEVYELAQ
ncbi:MAG: hypothetical protein JST00_03190 [Deltaproteobacteria bacterium]|nr:hypothetical protein [Deltaproteobacteria bacterium]